MYCQKESLFYKENKACSLGSQKGRVGNFLQVIVAAPSPPTPPPRVAPAGGRSWKRGGSWRRCECGARPEAVAAESSRHERHHCRLRGVGREDK